jgi:hypothetical protein
MALVGGPWTTEQKRAYRSAFTLGRIGDELWTLVAMTWMVTCVVLFVRLGGGIVYLVGVVAGFAGLYSFTWRVLLPWLEHTMPAELRASLLKDRFAGPSSLSAPRTYGELFQRWVRQRTKAL